MAFWRDVSTLALSKCHDIIFCPDSLITQKNHEKNIYDKLFPNFPFFQKKNLFIAIAVIYFYFLSYSVFFYLVDSKMFLTSTSFKYIVSRCAVF